MGFQILLKLLQFFLFIILCIPEYRAISIFALNPIGLSPEILPNVHKEALALRNLFLNDPKEFLINLRNETFSLSFHSPTTSRNPSTIDQINTHYNV